MKRIAALFFLGLTFLACNQDEEKGSEVYDALIGNWYYASMEMDGSNILSNMEYRIEMEFKSDSTFVREIGEITEYGTWKLMNDTTVYIEPDHSELGGQKLHLIKLSEEEMQYLIRSEGDEAEVKVTLKRIEEES